MFEKIKKWYKQGLWTEQMIQKAVERGIISEEQYKEIVSEV